MLRVELSISARDTIALLLLKVKAVWKKGLQPLLYTKLYGMAVSVLP